ncbi:MAG: putative endonuclease [Verrucomicrobiaceae bacterium]|nr:putative endonuclease [Verrucomicrobiaceae bacterium]
MLEPFMPPTQTGFSQRPGEGWSGELLTGLDWMRMGELLRAIAVNAGCELGPSRVQPDGSIEFAMMEAPKERPPRRALVKLAAWNQWGATPEAVQVFAHGIKRIRESCRGVLVAPAGFSAAALTTAAEQHIEAVDAAKLNSALQAMQPDQSDFFFTITTGGDYTVPSCPICLKKLSRIDQPGTRAMRVMPSELVYQSSTVVPETVLCERLEVLGGCEVTFLHEVRAREVIIAGNVSGDFVCEGAFVLEAGGSLSGTVAARSFKVREGAEMLGQMRIIEGALDPITAPAVNWFWRCQNGSGNPLCNAVMFEPH